MRYILHLFDTEPTKTYSPRELLDSDNYDKYLAVKSNAIDIEEQDPFTAADQYILAAILVLQNLASITDHKAQDYLLSEIVLPNYASGHNIYYMHINSSAEPIKAEFIKKALNISIKYAALNIKAKKDGWYNTNLKFIKDLTTAMANISSATEAGSLIVSLANNNTNKLFADKLILALYDIAFENLAPTFYAVDKKPSIDVMDNFRICVEESVDLAAKIEAYTHNPNLFTSKYAALKKMQAHMDKLRTDIKPHIPESYAGKIVPQTINTLRFRMNNR